MMQKQIGLGKVGIFNHIMCRHEFCWDWSSGWKRHRLSLCSSHSHESMSVIMMPIIFMLLASLSKLQLVSFPAGDKSTYYL